MSVKIQHHWENVSYSCLGIAASLAVSLLLAVSSFDKREFPKNRRCGGLMKLELEGSIWGKLSVSISTWETPGGSDKRGGMRLSLFFSPVRPLTIIAPLALSSNLECGDNNQFLLMFYTGRNYHYSQGKIKNHFLNRWSLCTPIFSFSTIIFL